MAVFDDVIEDVASRFGLGTKAGPLMREVVQLVTGSPGGIGGFIDKLKRPVLALRSPPGLARPTAPCLRHLRCRQHSAATC